MGIGDSILNDIHAGVERDIEERHAEKREAHAARSRAQADLDFAACYALRKAEEAIVRQHWPDHPLFTDPSLAQRINAAGEMAWGNTKSWEAVATAGKTFSMPPFDFTTKGERALRDSLRAADEALLDEQRAHASVAASLQALREEHERVSRLAQDMQRNLAQHVAVTQALRVELQRVCPDSLLATDSATRQRLGDRGYEVLRATQDWQAVRDVGASFVDGRRTSMDADPAADGDGQGAEPDDAAAALHLDRAGEPDARDPVDLEHDHGPGDAGDAPTGIALDDHVLPGLIEPDGS